jgi:mRNA-degrading endonuclease toxin of MazEF toxin-antitoxin module
MPSAAGRIGRLPCIFTTMDRSDPQVSHPAGAYQSGNSGMAGVRRLLRGMVIDLNLDPVLGLETGKIRPCVVVTNDAYNDRVPVIQVTPITAWNDKKSRIITNVTIEPSRANGLTKSSRTLRYSSLAESAPPVGTAAARLFMRPKSLCASFASFLRPCLPGRTLALSGRGRDATLPAWPIGSAPGWSPLFGPILE